MAELIVDLTLSQEKLLIEGRLGSADFPPLTPSDLKKLSGIAYLSGGDTWVDGERFTKTHLCPYEWRIFFFSCTIHQPFILVTLIVPRLFGVAFTQPDKVRQNEKDDRLWYTSTFKKPFFYVFQHYIVFFCLSPRPSALALLREMSKAFAYHLSQMKELLQDIRMTQQQHEGGGYKIKTSNTTTTNTMC